MPPGRPRRRARPACRRAIGHDFADLRPAAPGACPPVVVCRDAGCGSATSGWSSSATPCSAGRSPTSSFRRFDALPKGLLTDLRKSVVNAHRARRGRRGDRARAITCCSASGEAAAGGAEKPSILSDAFEAVLGAVYLDGGRRRCLRDGRAVGRAPDVRSSIDRLDQLDHKTQLQELCAATVGTWRPGVRRHVDTVPTMPRRSHARRARRRRSASASGAAGRRRRPNRPAAAPSRAAAFGWIRRCPSCPRSRPSDEACNAHLVGRRIERGRGRAGAGRSPHVA